MIAAHPGPLTFFLWKNERRQNISVWTGDMEEICKKQLMKERRQNISVWTGDIEEICPTTD